MGDSIAETVLTQVNTGIHLQVICVFYFFLACGEVSTKKTYILGVSSGNIEAFHSRSCHMYRNLFMQVILVYVLF